MPPQLWELELWELNLCVKEFNLMQSDDNKVGIAQAWRTANFTGAAVHGSLKDLSEYTGDNAKRAPKITFEEFDRKLAALKGGNSNVDV
jgi:hypothetical protein